MSTTYRAQTNAHGFTGIHTYALGPARTEALARTRLLLHHSLQGTTSHIHTPHH